MIKTRKLHNQLLGKHGEDQAVAHLKSYDYQIIERNWRTKLGEIDIIAQKADIIYFIEVKTRSNTNYGYPTEAINTKKLHRMHLTAQIAMQRFNNNYQEYKLLLISILGNNCEILEL